MSVGELTHSTSFLLLKKDDSLGWAHSLSAAPAILLLSLSGLRQWTRWTHTQAWLSKCSPTTVLPWLSTTFPSSSSCVLFPQFLQSPTVSFKSFLPHFYLPSRQLQSRLQTACQCSQFSKLAGHCPALKPSRNYTHPHPEEERKSIQHLPSSPSMLLWAFLATSSDFPVSSCPISLLIP